jgi:hypothetical protein
LNRVAACSCAHSNSHAVVDVDDRSPSYSTVTLLLLLLLLLLLNHKPALFGVTTLQSLKYAADGYHIMCCSPLP